MKHWEVCAALHNPNGMLKQTKWGSDRSFWYVRWLNWNLVVHPDKNNLGNKSKFHKGKQRSPVYVEWSSSQEW
jgi:hypothetical protein